MGFDGFTVEISSEALKKAAEGAQTISTSNNGTQIKLKGDSLQNLFARNETIEEVSLNNLDTSNITNMESVFAFCQQLKSIQIGNWNVSNVTNMHDMFWYCTNLTDIDLSKWDTSNVTNMNLMFDACVSLKALDIESWNVEKVTSMNHMFFCCRNGHLHEQSDKLHASILVKDNKNKTIFKKFFTGRQKISREQKTFSLPGNATLTIYHSEGKGHLFNTNDNNELKTKLGISGNTYTYKVKNNQLILIDVSS